MKTVPLVVALLGVAAAPAAPPAQNLSYQQRLMKLDKPRQAATLRGAIVASGKRCGRIEPPLYRGPYKNLFLWAARCAPGGDYAIYVGPDGSAQVRGCDEAARLKLPTCGLPPAKPGAKANRRS